MDSARSHTYHLLSCCMRENNKNVLILPPPNFTIYLYSKWKSITQQQVLGGGGDRVWVGVW